MTHVHVHGGGPAPAVPEAATPSWRLLATLGTAGAVAGALVGLVYTLTIGRVREHRAATMREAIAEVLHEPARWDTLYMESDRLVLRPTGDVASLPRVFKGYDANGKEVGVAVLAAEPGFTEVISLIFGFDPESGRLLGMKVLEQKDTPGLGDKIQKDSSFVNQFAGAIAPLKGVKRRSGSAGEVDVISGATISSRAVVRIINNAVARWRPMLLAYQSGGTTP